MVPDDVRSICRLTNWNADETFIRVLNVTRVIHYDKQVQCMRHVLDAAPCRVLQKEEGA